MTGALFGAPFFIPRDAAYFALNIYLRFARSSFVFAAVWLIIMTILFCVPGTKLPKVQWHDKIFLDKWIHLFLFLVLVLLCCRASITKTKKVFLVIMVLSIAYGITMELVQQFFIPFRTFDLRDMIANSAGAVAGYFIAAKRLLNKN